MHLSELLKHKDAALARKDNEMANLNGVMEERQKEILHLRLSLKGITQLLIVCYTIPTDSSIMGQQRRRNLRPRPMLAQLRCRPN